MIWTFLPVLLEDSLQSSKIILDQHANNVSSNMFAVKLPFRKHIDRPEKTYLSQVTKLMKTFIINKILPHFTIVYEQLIIRNEIENVRHAGVAA